MQHWECRHISVQTDEFVQILNSNRNSNHWVPISAVNCAPGEVQVYDNLYRTESEEINELVVSMIHTDMMTLGFTRLPMVMQGTPKFVFPIFMILLFEFD